MGGPGACGWFCGSLVKSPAGVDLPPWRLSCSLTRADGGLAMEDKGTHMQCVRARTATWVPGDTGRWVLLCLGDVTVCCSIYCCCRMWVQGLCYLTKGVSWKTDCMWIVRRETLKGWNVRKEQISQDADGQAFLPHSLSLSRFINTRLGSSWDHL